MHSFHITCSCMIHVFYFLQSPHVYNPDGNIRVIAVDVGMKYNQIRCLVRRGACVTVVPWDYDFNKDGKNDWMDGWMNGWMDEWMDEWMDG